MCHLCPLQGCQLWLHPTHDKAYLTHPFVPLPSTRFSQSAGRVQSGVGCKRVTGSARRPARSARIEAAHVHPSLRGIHDTKNRAPLHRHRPSREGGHGVNPQTALEDKLRESRIPPKTAETLGLHAVDSAISVHDSFYDLPALVIPYPTHPGYSRVRYLGPLPDELGKYGTPKGAPSHPYQTEPPAEDVQEVFITEGELKAISAQHWLGDHWIGLVGVWNFGARNDYHERQIHPDLLALFDLPELVRVTLVFDFEPIGAGGYFDVRKAAVRLAGALHRESMKRGRTDLVVSVLDSSTLPGIEDESEEKCGIDDWIARELAGGASKKKLQHLFDHTLERYSRPLGWDLNDGVSYALHRFVLDEQTARPFDTAHLCHRTQGEFMACVGGVGDVPPGAIYQAWIGHYLKTRVPRVYYEYARPSGIGPDGFNVYTPPPHIAVPKRRAKVDRLETLIETIANHDSPAVHQYIMNWLAHTVQSTERAHTSLAFTGMKGTGKSQLGRLMSAVLMDRMWADRFKRTDLNPNVRRLTRSVLDSRFWLAGLVHSRLVLLDESLFEGKDAISLVDRVKSLITDDVQLVEPKGLGTYDARIHFNLLMTSNDPDLVRLFGMQDERRFLNVWGTAKQDQEWYSETEAWIQGPDCGPAVYQHLLNLDISEFNPRVIPVTVNNESVAELGTNAFETWLFGLFGVRGQYVGDYRLQGPHPDEPVTFWRVSDVQRVYEQDTKQRVSPQLVGRAFKVAPWITLAAEKVRHAPHPHDLRVRDNIYAFDGEDYSTRKPKWIAAEWERTWLVDFEERELPDNVRPLARRT